ncbi:hypothetical protein GALL_204660 [mine drainage metagenome]|uniref:Lipoprotein n=1 Tax=mine drainage metagenome TaxID=410659 RepID=A0A1J5RMK4_9ZZZZ
MKTIRNLFFFLVIIVFVSCTHNLAPQGQYQSSAIVADGNASEWEMPLRFANKYYTISYNITNDKKNIYIVVVSKDDEMEKRILRSGITIYFDPKGENNRKISLTYPERKAGVLNINPRNGRPIINDTSNTKHAMVLKSDTYDVKGFYELQDGRFSVKDKRSKIQVGLKTDVDSGLVYEAVIPINYVLENGLTDKALKKNFSIGIVVHENAVAANRRMENNSNNNSGMRPRISIGGGFGGFGYGGVGMGIGMGGGRMRRQGNDTLQEEIMWYQFRFTTSAN